MLEDPGRVLGSKHLRPWAAGVSNTAMAAPTERTSRRVDPSAGLGRWGWAGLALLVLLGLFMVFAVISDLTADAAGGIPTDHAGTFGALSHTSWDQARAAAPGVADYITLLERGYALHELTVALLFLVIVLIPFRRRRRWAWWSLWLLLFADLGYTLTFGIHDSTIFTRSLIADIALPVLLLAHIPAFFARRPGTMRARHVDLGPPGGQLDGPRR